VADHPLRPATRRRLGEPLPHQQADGTRTDPSAQVALLSLPSANLKQTYAVLANLSVGYPSPKGTLSTCYSPVRHFPRSKPRFTFDLHVLSMPPAFVLSQDQTLQLKSFDFVVCLPVSMAIRRLDERPSRKLLKDLMGLSRMNKSFSTAFAGEPCSCLTTVARQIQVLDGALFVSSFNIWFSENQRLGAFAFCRVSL
jgi:hypothetical protein